MNGYLNVLKPPGVTSHDVVDWVRRLSGQQRVGHAGTLDPAAVGVLPVAMGLATRTISSPQWDRKLYWADVRFGTSTDTDDATGRVVATSSGEFPTLDAATAALGLFTGDILQRPPAYSALHVAGRRAYDRARRGLSADLPLRSARVDAMAIVGWSPPVLSLLIQCRSGTYVRSIARDLGAALHCPAHLASLVRIRVGPFHIADAMDAASLRAVAKAGTWDRVLWPTDIAAPAADAIAVEACRSADFGHGRPWLSSEAETPEGRTARVYTDGGHFLGFARRLEGARWQPVTRPRWASGVATPTPAGAPLAAE